MPLNSEFFTMFLQLNSFGPGISGFQRRQKPAWPGVLSVRFVTDFQTFQDVPHRVREIRLRVTGEQELVTIEQIAKRRSWNGHI